MGHAVACLVEWGSFGAWARAADVSLPSASMDGLIVCAILPAFFVGDQISGTGKTLYR
jgi:hypothetical protein